MIRYIIIIFSCLLLACNSKNVKNKKVVEIKGKSFQLFKPKNQKGTLVLFPGFGGGGSENTKNEFKILDFATKNRFSLVFMDFDHHVFLKDFEKEALKMELETIFDQYRLNKQKVYIGGFSAGGNVSLLLSDYLIQKKSNIVPEGVFVVDSPVDLLRIYETSQKNIKNNFNTETVEESKWIVENFNTDFGNPENDIKKYESCSPFVFKTKNISNLIHLKNVKIRLYTEPDIEWWKSRNNNDYEDLNAFAITKLAEVLKLNKFKSVQEIRTKNKGFRANGDRHPHSWSIVNPDGLFDWMLK